MSVPNETKAKGNVRGRIESGLTRPTIIQTICMPGQRFTSKMENSYSKLPPLNEESRNQNTTGYSILKYVEYNTTYIPTIDGEGKMPSASYTIPYADILLNYAEGSGRIRWRG